MRKLSSVLLSLLALITFSACYNYYVPIPVGPSSPLNPTTPVITVTDEQVQESITEAQEIAEKITAEIPKLPGAGASWDTSDDSGFDYTYNNDSEPTARYGSFEKMMGIDGFVDIGAVNNTINSVSLLGKTYSASELVSVSVGNSNFVKDYVFTIENGRLKINMFYYYSSLLYGYGISVNGERVEEYDGSLSGTVTDVAITNINATINGNSTAQPSVTEVNGEFNIVFTLNGNGKESPYIQFGEAKSGDVAIIKKIIDNGDPVISFDIATTDGTWGAYPYGWQPVIENMENKTEQREYMILRGNEIIHYNLAINYSVESSD